MEELSRRTVLGWCATATAVTGCLGDDSGNGPATNDAQDDPAVSWREATQTDVVTGEEFSFAGFEQPVFLHTFAIWCSTCSRQHQAFDEFHASTGADHRIVEVNIDPGEDAGAVRAHVSNNEYDWYFSIASDTLADQLAAEFGNVMLSPPASPVILLCPEGETVVLDDESVIGATALDAALAEHC